MASLPANTGRTIFASEDRSRPVSRWPMTTLSQYAANLRVNIRLVLIACLANIVKAQEPNSTTIECSTEADQFVGNSQQMFKIGPWITRGVCVRQNNQDAKCYQTLLGVLTNLNELRSAEYNGASGVLALLPTIGALLGAPTNEIWRLLTIVPFGGVLAMFLSFGGAILPVRVEDYEPSLNKELHSDSSFSLRNKKRGASKTNSAKQADEVEVVTQNLLKQIEKKMHSPDSVRFKKTDIWLGFFGMFLLFGGSQAAMSVVEQGAVLPWWCVSRWWMHMWYFMVTLTAIAENWAQLPFSDQFKLFLSDVPYIISVTGGEDITQSLEKAGSGDNTTISPNVETGKAIERAVGQLQTITPGVVHIISGTETTSPRNAILIIVSVIGSEGDEGSRLNAQSFWRLLTKSASIAVFVTGTAFFASAQLLALPMAVMALTLLLAAAVFGRAIASYITTSVGTSEPMIHVIVNSRSEAYQVIARIMLLTHDSPRREQNVEAAAGAAAVRDIQIELNGHIFVNCKRVAQRSRWWLNVLGIMAKPYDLAGVTRRRARGYELLPVTSSSSPKSE
ncbi:uncharacterized protein B0I36DRAFT_387802 [Microdochium trichocladiopsis]|uniref:Uncharacterized protein n=1 Tax=Microdochium trichocladiopsis TaxID=1682393 RepID=A0A9P8XVN0_9PEZI|nr:uncharacterized protein B0I36DRAFT_387802 [Microdochium trichocladiopsis]KAH7021005.1 hypothetical protein B0I36DRAFT_387802 [Microdochium trichocladiopsis]